MSHASPAITSLAITSTSRAALNELPPKTLTETLPSAGLRNQFQGALLGLMLTPTAVSCLPIKTATEQSARTQLTLSMTRAIASTTAQIDQFLSTSLTTPSPGNTASWLDALPILLRYHDQPPSTRHKLWSTNPVNTAKYQIVSDVLSQVMSGQPISRRWIMQKAQSEALSQGESGQGKSSQGESNRLNTARSHYQKLWQAIWNTLQEERARFSTTERTHADFITGIVFTLTSRYTGAIYSNQTNHHLKRHAAISYGQTISLAAQQGLNALKVKEAAIASRKTSVLISDLATHALSEGILVRGLLSGAIAGRSELPISWQLSSPGTKDWIRKADKLFEHWAGITTGLVI